MAMPASPPRGLRRCRPYWLAATKTPMALEPARHLRELLNRPQVDKGIQRNRGPSYRRRRCTIMLMLICPKSCAPLSSSVSTWRKIKRWCGRSFYRDGWMFRHFYSEFRIHICPPNTNTRNELSGRGKVFGEDQDNGSGSI